MDDLIYRSAAIDALSRGEGCGNICRRAIERIPSAQRWIPVSKQHPFNEYGEGKSVLTVDTLGVMRVAEYVGGVWQTPDGEPITNTKAFPITHWRELPEPPKEEP